DANSCTSTTTGTITQPDAVDATSSHTAILCYGGSSTVTVSASGGTAPYNGDGTFKLGRASCRERVTHADSAHQIRTETTNRQRDRQDGCIRWHGRLQECS